MIQEQRPKAKVSTLSLGWVIIFLIPSFTAFIWSVWPALNSIAAVASFKAIEFDDESFNSASLTHDLRRNVQKQFLDHGLYIPLEDIFLGNLAPNNGQEFSLLMQKACGRGKLHVWVPLRVRLPIVGDQVYEWCWKTRIKRS